MGTKITYTTLESAPYANLLEVVDTRSNIGDPRDPDDDKRRTFVYDSDPFDQFLDFALLPYIILPIQSTLDYSKESLCGTKKELGWSNRLTVRTVKKGSRNFDHATGRADMLSICDDLHKTFNNATIKRTFQNYNMRSIKLTKINYETVTINNQEVYESEFEITYKTRMDTA